MAESTIITGQFVRINQTPAHIGERIVALVIDYMLIGLYFFFDSGAASLIPPILRHGFGSFLCHGLSARSPLSIPLRNV